MALRLTKVAFNGNIHGRYVAEVYFTKWQRTKHGGHFSYTTYRYLFNDSLLYDELKSDDISKKRMRELISHVKFMSQWIMRHNSGEWERRDGK